MEALTFVYDDEAIAVAEALFNPEATHVEIRGFRFPIETTSSEHLRKCSVNRADFMEQNRTKSSNYARRARDGHRIVWVMLGRIWGQIEDGVIRKRNSFIRRRDDGSDTAPARVILRGEGSGGLAAAAAAAAAVGGGGGGGGGAAAAAGGDGGVKKEEGGTSKSIGKKTSTKKEPAAAAAGGGGGGGAAALTSTMTAAARRKAAGGGGEKEIIYWAWLNDIGDWERYEDKIEKLIEAAFKLKKKNVFIEVGPWTIDFEKMTQTNWESGKIRNVKRVVLEREDETSARGTMAAAAAAGGGGGAAAAAAPIVAPPPPLSSSSSAGEGEKEKSVKKEKVSGELAAAAAAAAKDESSKNGVVGDKKKSDDDDGSDSDSSSSSESEDEEKKNDDAANGTSTAERKRKQREKEENGAAAAAEGGGGGAAAAAAATPVAAEGGGAAAVDGDGSEGSKGKRKAHRTSVAMELLEQWVIRLSEIELGKRLGAGAFGEVRMGTYRGAAVAVKILHEAGHSASHDEELKKQKESFLQESSLLCRLRHPNIVSFLGVSVEDMILVMELLPSNLQTRLRSGRLELSLTLDIARGIAAGMSYLHSFVPAIIHRDLKPGNVLLDANDRPKIADFGISRANDAESTMTKIATPCYAAPQILLDKTYDNMVDVFSFGIMLNEMITGVKPYSDVPGGFSLNLMRQIAKRGKRPTLPPPSSSCPPTLIGLITSCWLHIPHQRPPFDKIIVELNEIAKNASVAT